MKTPSFISLTKYLIRDRAARRSAMFYILLIAMLMVFLGSTFFAGALASNIWWFLGFWLACAWMTIGAFLLAMCDLAALRTEAREERRRLRKRYFGETRPRECDENGPGERRDCEGTSGEKRNTNDDSPDVSGGHP